MSFYFNNFPRVEYNPPIPKSSGIGSAQKSSKTLVVTDISTRFIIKQILGDPNLIYYDYAIKDEERPDIIAEKYYGDSRLDWLLLTFNQVVDPYFEWPLSQRNFERFVRQKYGSIEAAQSTIERYERRIYPESEHNDGLGNIIKVPARFVTVDKSTHDSLLPAERRIIYAYDHEENKNEAKREIKILDKDFVPELITTFKEYFD